jgi:8-oxo-dGTP pyrophosphatase MutT (NUDIX family)
MQILHIFDNKDYNPLWKSYNREAVRAIIIKNKQIALVRSKNEGFYKFPGGGIELNETHIDALIRETREETGLHIITESVKEFGMLWEMRRGLYADEIFSQKSYYYYAQISDISSKQELDEYEIELGYELEWADIKNAYHINTELGKNDRFSFLIREAYILNLLMLSFEHTT